MTMTADERRRFIAAARALVGAPFKHRGRSAEGVDCVGLVVLALAAVGRGVADRDDYGRNPFRDGLREAAVAHFGEPVSDMQAGDVVLFAWGRDEPNHVGILFDRPAGGLAVVHALRQHKRVVEHGLSPDQRARIVAVFRPFKETLL